MDFKIPLILFSVLFTLLSSSQAFKFYVGGNDGWTLNPSGNYNQWAAKNRFQIKDTIVFKYKKGSDSMLEVKKEDYEKCIKTNPIKKFEEGDTELTLDRSGPFYFISGKDENCEKGQKLNLVVLSQRKQTQTPPPQSPSVPPPITSPSPSGSPTAYTPSVSPSPVGNSPSVSPSPAISPVPAGGPTASPPSPISTPPAGVPTATSPSPGSTPPAGGPTATSPSPTSAPAGGPAALSPSLSPTSTPASGPASSSPSPTSAPAGGPAATPPSQSPTSTTPIGSPPPPGTPSSPSPAPGGTANPPGSSNSTATAPAPAPSSGTSVASSRFLMYSVTIVVGAALLCHGTVLG